MSHSILHRLNLVRGAYLWGCLRAALKVEAASGDGRDLGDGPSVQGEIVFLFGTEDDPTRPAVYLDSLNLVLDEAEQFGGRGGTPSVCLAPGFRPRIEIDPRSGKLAGSFEALVDFPAVRRRHEERERDRKTDTPGMTGLPAKVRIEGRIASGRRPVEFGFESLEAEVSISLPMQVQEMLKISRLIIPVVTPLLWLRLDTKRELKVQPVFLSAASGTPPTGEDFYPGLARANELWGRCCVEFDAKCPIYVDEQDWRVATEAEARAFKDSRDVSDAVEVFIVEELDPVDMWGGGATFGSGTAAAKVVSTDNQLPLNQNHLAHELGHVLGLGHPGDTTDNLVDGCVGSVMEPSGFFADNPGVQCEDNCQNASNPHLRLRPGRYCLSVDRPDIQLF